MYVIYGINKDNKVILYLRDCKKPTKTKEYKSLENRFDLLESDLFSFGYMTLKELRNRMYWIDYSSKLSDQQIVLISKAIEIRKDIVLYK
jgi:hypothetical protein